MVADAINGRIDEAVAQAPWLTKVNVHMVGFSAGACWRWTPPPA